MDFSLSGARFAKISDDLAFFRLHGTSITGSGGHSKTNEASRAYHERVFLKAQGRNGGKVDCALDRVGRLAENASDPAYLVARISAAFEWSRRVKREGNTMREAP